MDMDKLKEYKTTLERKYDELDEKIMELDEKGNQSESDALEDVLDKIDEQLDLIEDIIDGYYNTPKKYEELMKLKDKYKSLIGE